VLELALKRGRRRRFSWDWKGPVGQSLGSEIRAFLATYSSAAGWQQIRAKLRVGSVTDSRRPTEREPHCFALLFADQRGLLFRLVLVRYGPPGSARVADSRKPAGGVESEAYERMF